MGARLNVPSAFSVDRSTTGVPKYRTGGVMVTWPACATGGAVSDGCGFMLVNLGG
jgi:hypothetical protein